MDKNEQAKKLVSTAINWTCSNCPKRANCPASKECFDTFLLNLEKLLKRANPNLFLLGCLFGRIYLPSMRTA